MSTVLHLDERRRREAEADAAIGIRWWNQLTRSERAAWLQRANSAVPADAWAAFKNSTVATPKEVTDQTG